MKRYVIRISGSIAVFLLLFAIVQDILWYNRDTHWYHWDEDWDEGKYYISFLGRDAAYESEPELWKAENDPSLPDDISSYYYEELIGLCQDQGIAAVIPPGLEETSEVQSHLKVMKEYFGSSITVAKYLD